MTSDATLKWGIEHCRKAGALELIDPRFWARTHSVPVEHVEALIAEVRKEAAELEDLRSRPEDIPE